jgi:RES domain
MRLVDNLDEQAVLEVLLETSKPPLPAVARHQHYLLTTPFRYRPRYGSRFRRAGSRGIWYGAQDIRTACAEVAYWRWRFIVESSGLHDEELLTEHTVFAAQVSGSSIDLMASPWLAARRHWIHPSDYAATQNLADAARAHGVNWLQYESARDPGGACCAVFTPEALSGPDLTSQQTWHCRTTRLNVRMVHDSERYEWSMDGG